MTTASEARHMARVAELPCACCGVMPVEVHHMLQGRTPGRMSPNWLTIPLCPDCHRGSKNGVHGEQGMLKVMRTNEHDMLADTLNKLYGHIK
jgi:hypothetical protein